MLQTNYEKTVFLAYGNESDKFSFIVVPALGPEKVPTYKVISSDKNDIFISLQEIKQNCHDEVKYAFDNEITIEDYLKKFIKVAKPKKPKALKTKLLIEEEDIKE